jgi:xanthine dehydrogenase accessory factor
MTVTAGFLSIAQAPIADRLVVVRGGGDLASGVAARLVRCGFAVVCLETAAPLAVRRTVSFAEAVYEGRCRVEELEAVLAGNDADCLNLLERGLLPVLVDPQAALVESLRPRVVVDAIMAKRNLGTARGMAPLVVALGPGFEAGSDVHAVVETMRGHDLGRVIWRGRALPNTGTPGLVEGKGADRVLRAPIDGRLEACRAIGDRVEEGELVARVRGESGCREVRSPFTGMIRGLVREGIELPRGIKIGDIDPRCERAHCFTISDKARAVAGGVLEAVLQGLGGRLP